ncbi:LCP family protein [bacterium]|nr:LCP family protein [bacterium]
MTSDKFEQNLLENEALDIQEIQKKFKKKKSRIIIKNVFFLFLVIFLLSIFLLSNFAARSESSIAQNIKKNPLINQISHLIAADTKKLKGETQGRTNLLILGMGGEGHDGALLTDTMIILSYNHDSHETSMVSIPRDMVVKTEKNLYKKINHLYTIGEYQEDETGLNYTKKITENNIGIPIHYSLAIDFFGFEEIIDALGGINVYIENSFIDYQYPTKNHKIMTVNFETGSQHLSGEESLQFARSRHGIVTSGNGFEASDFARSERQFKIIQAIKEKMLSFSTLTNPNKIIKLFQILKKYIETDIENWEAIRFVEFLREMDRDKIFNTVLNDAPGNLLRNATSTYDGAFILIPKNNDYNLLSSFFRNIFESNELDKEQAKIHILNGTKIGGLASQSAQRLINLGINVERIDNSPNQNTTSTLIIDLSKNKKPETLNKIQEEIFGIRSNIIPEELKNYLGLEDLDFLIILGHDLVD